MPTPDQGAAAVHADLDGDRISESLAALTGTIDPTERVAVVVTWTGPVAAVAALAAAPGLDINTEFTIIQGFAATMPAGQVAALSHVPGVFRVEPDFQVSAVMDEATPDWGINDARSAFSVTGFGVRVAVLDTGLDPNHEQTDTKVAPGDWKDFVGTSLVPIDPHGHGTHVASTVAGDGVGGLSAAQFTGVAPDAELIIGRVLDANGSGPESGIISAIQWAETRGADVLSMSLGTNVASDGLTALDLAVNAFVANGGVAVIAAGNSGDGPQTVGFPGAAALALTAGAVGKATEGLRLAPFSSRGPNLSNVMKPQVTSPGVNIVAAQAGTSAGYVGYSGTSMATPFLAGIVALML